MFDWSRCSTAVVASSSDHGGTNSRCGGIASLAPTCCDSYGCELLPERSTLRSVCSEVARQPAAFTAASATPGDISATACSAGQPWPRTLCSRPRPRPCPPCTLEPLSERGPASLCRHVQLASLEDAPLDGGFVGRGTLHLAPPTTTRSSRRHHPLQRPSPPPHAQLGPCAQAQPPSLELQQRTMAAVRMAVLLLACLVAAAHAQPDVSPTPAAVPDFGEASGAGAGSGAAAIRGEPCWDVRCRRLRPPPCPPPQLRTRAASLCDSGCARRPPGAAERGTVAAAALACLLASAGRRGTLSASTGALLVLLLAGGVSAQAPPPPQRRPATAPEPPMLSPDRFAPLPTAVAAPILGELLGHVSPLACRCRVAAAAGSPLLDGWTASVQQAALKSCPAGPGLAVQQAGPGPCRSRHCCLRPWPGRAWGRRLPCCWAC